jgi:hypothetical protein
MAGYGRHRCLLRGRDKRLTIRTGGIGKTVIDRFEVMGGGLGLAKSDGRRCRPAPLRDVESIGRSDSMTLSAVDGRVMCVEINWERLKGGLKTIVEFFTPSSGMKEDEVIGEVGRACEVRFESSSVQDRELRGIGLAGRGSSCS